MVDYFWVITYCPFIGLLLLVSFISWLILHKRIIYNLALFMTLSFAISFSSYGLFLLILGSVYSILLWDIEPWNSVGWLLAVSLPGYIAILVSIILWLIFRSKLRSLRAKQFLSNKISY